jgi:hypothetical protein
MKALETLRNYDILIEEHKKLKDFVSNDDSLENLKEVAVKALQIDK